MNLIAFIFSLVQKFVPMNPTEFASMKMEADEWSNKILADKKASGWKAFYRDNSSKWFIRLSLAIIWIPASIWIGRELNDVNNPPKLDEHNERGSAW